jgi:hypothetical protein
MTALWHSEPWESLLVWVVEAGVVWGAAAVAPDLETSGLPSRHRCKGGV